MKTPLTDELCTICGLCCDGSLLDDVELASEQEALGLEIMGLNIDTDGRPAMILPCSALQGTRCSIYKNRPQTCRHFECKLLQRAQLGEIPVGQAKRTIQKTLKQAAKIKNTCFEIENKEPQGSLREMYQSVFENHEEKKDPQQVLYSRLSKEMDSLNALINEHFLDE